MPKRRTLPRALSAGALACAALLATARARAVDPFEIQVYDGTASPQGVFGLELHLNYWATGHRSANAPELPLVHQGHVTLEPSFGVLPWWEIGAYFQSAIRADGTPDYAGTKLRSKFVTPPGWSDRWRLGLNFELSYVPERYEADRWGGEVRPIVAYDDERWLFAFNPILALSFGPGFSDGPAFEPALKGTRTVGPVAVGLEYYVSIGPLASPVPLREQEHYLYEVVDLVSVKRLELSAGLGEGLTAESAGLVAKVIVGWTFEPAEASDRPGGDATASVRRARPLASRFGHFAAQR